MVGIKGRTRLDAGWGVLLLLCLVAIWPFLSRSALPQETDAELHIFRLAEMARLIAGGEVYPRWAPNFYFGYGYPIFNYYAPLVYLLGLIPMALGLGAVGSVKLLFVAGLLLGAVATYGFVRGRWGSRAGLVAAAATVYAPYIQFVDPHARGDLAEAFSLALLPLGFWTLDHLARRPSGAAWLAASVTAAAIVLAHNLMAMVAVAMLFAWALWLRLPAGPGEPEETGKRHGAGAASYLPLLALLAGIGMAAFFWLPVALEQEAVNLKNLIGDGSHFDFRNHFQTLRGLLSPSAFLDWRATEADFSLNLGLAQWLLGAIGLGVVMARPRVTRAGWYFALAALLLVALMLPVSEVVWDTVPLLPFLQFPWRLLGPVAFVLAVLAGVGVTFWGTGSGWRSWAWVGSLIVIVGTGLPLSEVPPWPGSFGDTSVARVADIEFHGRWLGTTATADFVPATVDVIPEPNPQLMAALWANEAPDRVNRATLPEGATVAIERVRPLHTRYEVGSPEPFALRLFQFAFPGWQVDVDGEEVATEIGLPEGFLVVPLPAGDHSVDVVFGSTPARQLASVISALSVLTVVGLAGVLTQRPSAAAERTRQWLPARDARQASLSIGFLTALHLLLFAPQGWLHLTSPAGRAIPAENDLYRVFGGELALIGFSGPERVLHPGDSVDVTLYWEALTEMDLGYQSFVHLLSPDGRPLAQVDKLNPGDFPTRRWPLGRYVRDRYRLTLPADLPAGTYRLTAGLWLAAEGRRLPVSDESGDVVGDVAVLQTVTVRP